MDFLGRAGAFLCTGVSIDSESGSTAAAFLILAGLPRATAFFPLDLGGGAGGNWDGGAIDILPLVLL